MQTEEYVQAIKDLLSKDPERVRAANRLLFAAATRNGASRNGGASATQNREADLVLAQVGG